VPATIVAETLEAWREGDRLLSRLEPASSDYEAAAEAVGRLRVVHKRLVRQTEISRQMVSEARWVITEARATFSDVRRRPSTPSIHIGD